MPSKPSMFRCTPRISRFAGCDDEPEEDDDEEEAEADAAGAAAAGATSAENNMSTSDAIFRTFKVDVARDEMSRCRV